MNSWTGSILGAGRNKIGRFSPGVPFVNILPDELLLIICHQLHDGGFGRSALSKFSRTCRRAHALALPILYRELKAIPGCCQPIQGRYEPLIPCSCSEENCKTGFPRLNLPPLVASLLLNPHLASLVEIVDLARERKAHNGRPSFTYDGSDCHFLFFFLLPNVKSIKMPVIIKLEEDMVGSSIVPRAADRAFKAALRRVAEEWDLGFPNVTNLHIGLGKGIHDPWNDTYMWATLSACTNLEVLSLACARGNTLGVCHVDPVVTLGMHSLVPQEFDFSKLVDLDIARSELTLHDFANMTQSCTSLRRVSMVQFHVPFSAESQSSGELNPNRIAPGPALILECFAASAATLEKLSISWARKALFQASLARPEAMALITPMRGFSALRLLELSYRELEKGDQDVLFNLIKECGKLEALKLICITDMPREELFRFACHVKDGAFPKLRMIKLCTNLHDSQSWAELTSIADQEIVSLLASGEVKLVLRPYHRKPGDPRFPELDFEGDNEPAPPADGSSGLA